MSRFEEIDTEEEESTVKSPNEFTIDDLLQLRYRAYLESREFWTEKFEADGTFPPNISVVLDTASLIEQYMSFGKVS